MEGREHHDRIATRPEINTVGKAPQCGLADAAVDGRVEKGIRRNPRELFIDSFEEGHTQSGALSFVPIACGFKLVACLRP